MEPFLRLDAVALPIPIDNLDTDRILPARYLQKPRSAPFGDYLFRDWRCRPDGSPNPDFALNQSAFEGARIIVGKRNFACGSSREHAVWALHDHGFRCAIAESFGDIFRSNAAKNGLLTVTLPAETIAQLLAGLAAAPGARVTVDLTTQQVMTPDGAVHHFTVEPFTRQCLLEGIDELAYTLTQQDHIAAFERTYTG